MRDYWEQLAPREKLLIGIAGLLIAVLLFTLLVMRPVLGFNERAKSRYENATETYTLVTRAASRPAGQEALEMTAVRSILTRSAGQNGIVINRINVQDANIDLSIANTRAARLYEWLARLENEHQIFVEDAQIRPANDGVTVTARLTVVSGA